MAEQVFLGQAPPDPAAWRPQGDAATVVQIVVSFTTTSAAYETVGNMNVNRPIIPDAKVHYDAGLRPQFRTSYWSSNTASGQNGARVRLLEFSTNDSGLFDIGHAAEVLNSPGGSGQYTVAPWDKTSFDVAPAEPHWVVVVEVKTSAGTASFQMLQILMRWV
jgi:hypothetical protein